MLTFFSEKQNDDSGIGERINCPARKLIHMPFLEYSENTPQPLVERC